MLFWAKYIARDRHNAQFDQFHIEPIADNVHVAFQPYFARLHQPLTQATYRLIEQGLQHEHYSIERVISPHQYCQKWPGVIPSAL